MVDNVGQNKFSLLQLYRNRGNTLLKLVLFSN